MMIEFRLALLIFILLSTNSTLLGQTTAQDHRLNIANTDFLFLNQPSGDSNMVVHPHVFYVFKDTTFCFLRTTQGLFGDVDSSVIGGGKWEIKSGNLLFLYEHFLSNTLYFTYPNKTWIFKIVASSSDSCQLMSTENLNSILNLKKIPNLGYEIPPITDTIGNTENQMVDFSNFPKQDLMVEFKTSNKKVFIPFNRSLRIYLFEDEINASHVSYGGNLLTCDSNYLYLKMTVKSTDSYHGGVYYDNRVQYPSNPDTTEFPWLKYYMVEQIPYDRIRQIKYSNMIGSEITGIVAMTSVVSALIVAPLASYNFRSGNFNQNRYYKIMVPSLITLGVSIPVSYLFGRKENNELDNSKNGLKFYPVGPK